MEASGKHLASIELLEKSVINKSDWEVFAVMFESDVDPPLLKHGTWRATTSGDCEKILTLTRKRLRELKEGKDKVIGFLVGQVMTERKAIAQVSEMIHKLCRNNKTVPPMTAGRSIRDFARHASFVIHSEYLSAEGQPQ